MRHLDVSCEGTLIPIEALSSKWYSDTFILNSQFDVDCLDHQFQLERFYKQDK